MSNLNKVAFELRWIVLSFDNGPKRPKNDTDFWSFCRLKLFLLFVTVSQAKKLDAGFQFQHFQKNFRLVRLVKMLDEQISQIFP